MKTDFYDRDRFDIEIGNWDYKEDLIRSYVLWKDEVTKILKRRYQAENVWDEKFIKLMDYVRYVDFSIIVDNVKSSLMKHKTEEINVLCMYYQQFHELWGTLDVWNNRYDVIINRVTALKEHMEDFIWLYDQLGDWRSKLVLTSMLYSWVTFDPAYITGMKEGNYTDYFDLDLVKCDEEEVMADLGAWEGDSALNYIQTYGRYKKIYCYEIDETTMEKMKKNLHLYSNIEYRNKGAGDKNEKKYIEIMGTGYSSCNKVVDHETDKQVEIVRLDDDINERLTLIKMDIEGAEKAALAGCVRHIREEKPKLLISVYHNNEDIWKIPRMLRDMNPDYQLYLRSNGDQCGPSEIVLIANMKEK